MATITKRGDKWRAQVRKADASPQSKTFATKRQAEAWATMLEAETLAGPVAKLSKVTLREAFDRYAKNISPTKRSTKWEVLKLAQLSQSILADYKVGSITSADLAIWRDDRLKEVKPVSVLREMALIGCVLEIARREWGIITVNPIKDVRKPLDSL